MEYAAYFHGQLFASHTQCLEGLKCNFYNNSRQFKRKRDKSLLIKNVKYFIHCQISILLLNQICMTYITLYQSTFRYATTLITSKVSNPENTSREVFMSVILPETAFISRFAIQVEEQVKNLDGYTYTR